MTPRTPKQSLLPLSAQRCVLLSLRQKNSGRKRCCFDLAGTGPATVFFRRQRAPSGRLQSRANRHKTLAYYWSNDPHEFVRLKVNHPGVLVVPYDSPKAEIARCNRISQQNGSNYMGHAQEWNELPRSSAGIGGINKLLPQPHWYRGCEKSTY